ncbi:MAG: CHAT domain-containing protein [Pseudonocardiaceae bacterium]
MLLVGAPRAGLDLGEEHRQVSLAVSRARYRDALTIHVEQAVRPNDVSYLFHHHQPHVVHFSGKGTQDSGILLRDDDGGLVPIEASGLRRLIERICPQAQLAVLNSCWSSELARELARACGCAVGMTAQLPDSTGVAFAAELYQAIAFGQSVGQAVETARAALELHGVYRPEIVQLVHRDDVDPEHVFVIPSRLHRPMDRESVKPQTVAIAHSGKRRFVAVVTGMENSEADFMSKLHSSSIESLQVRWISASSDHGRSDAHGVVNLVSLPGYGGKVGPAG